MSGSVCSYRGEDMQDGVNVPALGGCIPDRDTHTQLTQWCLRVTQKQTHTIASGPYHHLHAHTRKQGGALSGGVIYSRNTGGY